MAGMRGEQPTSRRFALDDVDLKKLGTGFVIAMVGALATFLSDAATSINFGMWSPFISMAISVAVNALRKWMADNSPSPPAEAAAGNRHSARADWTADVVVMAITVVTVALLALVFACSARPTSNDRVEQPVGQADPAVTRAFVIQRQLFARVCLEAARRERAGLIASEKAENEWCEPRWAAARTEAFGVLVESRDKQLAGGWTPESSAAGLEAWAYAADPTLSTEVRR